MPVLDVRGLTAAYGPHQALRGVSLTIEAGQVLGLLGPNGAGKTTLMDAVVGKVRPTGGSVTVCGYDVARQPRAVRARTGYAEQDLAVFPTLTVRQNVTSWAALGGLRRRARAAAVDSALAAMLLDGVADRQVRELSGGQRRRVHCAMATVCHPPLLLLDEPTVGVDPATRRAVLEHVRALAAEGTAVCYSTHYLPEVEALGADVVLLKDGATAAHGGVTELLDRFGRTVVELRLREAGGDDAAGSQSGERNVSVAVDSAAELPAVLQGLQDDLGRLTGLEIRRPTLDEVFDRIVTQEVH
ncbi:ATP-binding cassette domain-containing protein [Streptomyces sp. NPDC012935]|uniref:ABC transporter ATP-binding protein n=1 Tax=Streptomyces sp. NPDC012935 TaxID=3364857 RepID=UPI0036B2B5B9